MCGFTGFVVPPGWEEGRTRRVLGAMTETLRHRGPDDEGTALVGEGRVALGFRRLAILDLSPAGHQPMASAGGRFTLVFNGEVYNYRELRDTLAASGHAFRSGSDTEVILAAFEAWGVKAALSRFVGMFAMAVWDARERRLHLLRDRLGIKPLYYRTVGDALLFGSELKALMAFPGGSDALDPDAVADFLRYLYVPAPRAILKDTAKVPPGHVLTVVPHAGGYTTPDVAPYWDVDSVARAGQADPLEGDDDALLEQLDALLLDAVGLRLRSDVPLGALLSGGVDSSLVVALMRERSAGKVRTFSIGFDDPAHDESAHARAVAAHLGTEHTELRVGSRSALELVPRLPVLFDEPLANPSQIPTFLVCELARRHVTVALSGDGGDETFAGYHRYLAGEPTIRRLGRAPGPVRRAVGGVLGGIPPRTWDRLYGAAEPFLPGRLRMRLPGQKIQKVSRLMAARGPDAMYRSLLSAWQDPSSVLAVPGGGGDGGGTLPVLDGLMESMMAADQAHYLPDDLLAKVDRASMAVSLEVRVPLLDHRVVEMAWRMPRSMKVRNGGGKWALRQLLYRRVPRALVERPKVGFTVPLEKWLREGLRPWAEDLLRPESVAAPGLLRPDVVQRSWRRFLAGDGGAAPRLWAVLTLLAWHRAWTDTSPRSETRCA